MAAKDWYEKYAIVEAEGRHRRKRTKVTKEQFRRDILRLQSERKQREQMEVAANG